MRGKQASGVWTPEEILEQYRSQPRFVTPEFLASVDFESMAGLGDDVVFALAYMQRIEDAVWGVYFKEVAATPTGRNPQVAAFLETWSGEEAVHAAALDRVLARYERPALVSGRPHDSSWIARLAGERLFGAVHMAFGATNELMTAFGYRSLAKRCGNPELARLLQAIAKEEAIHYAFYYRMARHYLERSRAARWLTLRLLNLFAVGVGIGVVAPRDGHRVMRILFAGKREEFLQAVQAPIAKLPGLAGFTAMQSLVKRAQIA